MTKKNSEAKCLPTIPLPPIEAEDNVDVAAAEEAADGLTNNEHSMRSYLNSDYPVEDFLVGSVIPKRGLFCFYGDSACGKSSLFKELAMAVVSGKNFLSWSTFAEHRRVVYLSTEDEENDIKLTVHKFKQGWKAKGFDVENCNIDFVYGSFEWYRRVETLLQNAPADLLLVDTLGDLMNGEDSNSESNVRKVLEKLMTLGRKYGCAVGFLHHTNKSSEINGAKPSKHSASGSGAITKKPRLAVQVTRQDKSNDMLGLCFEKANTLGKEVTDYIWEVHFDKEPVTISLGDREIESVNLSFRASNRLTYDKSRLWEWQQSPSDYVSVFDKLNAMKKAEKEERIQTAKQLKAEGKTNAEIAELMDCSPESVRRYLK